MDRRTKTGREITADRKRNAAAEAIVKELFTAEAGPEVEVKQLAQLHASGLYRHPGYTREAVAKLIVKKLAAIGLQ